MSVLYGLLTLEVKGLRKDTQFQRNTHRVKHFPGLVLLDCIFCPQEDGSRYVDLLKEKISAQFSCTTVLRVIARRL